MLRLKHSIVLFFKALLSSISLTTFLFFPNVSAALALEMSGQGEAPLTCVRVLLRGVILLPLETGRDSWEKSSNLGMAGSGELSYFQL